MAEEEAAAEGGKNFLAHKIGPLPVAVWIGAALVIYLYLKKKNGTAAPGSQTDPAGNVGTIDPRTGYVYGTAGDTSGLAGASGGASFGASSGSSGSNSTTAGQYADNNAWSRAAINFLVGVGVDPTEANSAITQYVTSQTLTVQQQADVNLAVQSIGAPPVPPTPGNSPPPVVTPPSPGQVYASNPPSGLAVTAKSANSITLTWNRATNATAYTVTYSTGSQSEQSTTVAGTDTTTTLSGLAPGALYNIRVQGTPAKSGDGYASTSTTTANTPAPAQTPAPAPPPAPAPGPPPTPDQSPTTIPGSTYRAVSGDTWTSIAARFHLTESQLWAYNIDPAHNTSAQIATLKQRGQNSVSPGETIRVPSHA